MVGNSGRYSKFQQRLKNIYLSFFIKKRRKKNIQDEFVEYKVEERRKDFSNFKKNNIDNRKVANVKVVRDNCINIKKNNKLILVKSAIDIKKDKDIEKKNCFVSKKVNNKSKNSDLLDDKDINLVKMELISKLKSKFIEKEAILGVLESELFFISTVIDNSLNCNEINDLRKKIRKIIKEIDDIIEQYNLYSKNDSLNYVVDFDDNNLVDDIIDYRNLLNSYKDRERFVKEYKLLDEFKLLYLKLETIRGDVNRVDKISEEVIDKYNIRDEKYNQIKMNLLDIKGINEEYLNEVKRQNEFLDILMKKISVIDSQEVISKRMVGLNELLMQGVKFLGLKLLSPLSGFIPSIVGETVITKNMIKNIYKSMHSESVSHVYYSGIDYDNELNVKFNDIDYTEGLINDTLRDLKRVKEDFFSIYDSNILGYDDVLKNINKMEDIIYKNQFKVKFIKDKLKLGKKINDDKMIKVRGLNNSRR